MCGGQPEQRRVEGGVGRLALPGVLQQLHHGHLGQHCGAVGRRGVASTLQHCGRKCVNPKVKPSLVPRLHSAALFRTV